MNSWEALEIVKIILNPHCLSPIQEQVFVQSWMHKTYKEIAHEIGYDSDYIKEIGSELWKILSNILKCRVTKKNMQLVLEDYQQTLQLPLPETTSPFSPLAPVSTSPASFLETLSSLPYALEGNNFAHCLEQTWNQLQADAVWVVDFAPVLASLSLIGCELDPTRRPLTAINHDQALSIDLPAVAAHLRQQLKRSQDLLACVAPNQLMILLPQTESRGAIHVVQLMRTALQELNLNRQKAATEDQKLTLSFGVSTIIPHPQSSPSLLLATVSQALHQAKVEGGDRVVFKAG